MKALPHRLDAQRLAEIDTGLGEEGEAGRIHEIALRAIGRDAALFAVAEHPAPFVGRADHHVEGTRTVGDKRSGLAAEAVIPEAAFRRACRMVRALQPSPAGAETVT